MGTNYVQRNTLLKKHLRRNSDLVVISEYSICVLLCIFVTVRKCLLFLLKLELGYLYISKGTKGIYKINIEREGFYVEI